jgi:bifunctional DNA-binding transcriptional regulator/antitoxin component of YhaV-PrlF toxin-antitoxin module
MSKLAIDCKVDKLGRVTIPFQYRKALNINVCDDMKIKFKDNGLYLYKEDDSDALKKKINDIIEVASDCAVLNGNEREELNKILSKLV